MDNLDDPKAGKDNDKADDGASHGIFALLLGLFITYVDNSHEAAKNQQQKENDAGDDINVGENRGNESADVFITTLS